jgi:hypothetical protein
MATVVDTSGRIASTKLRFLPVPCNIANKLEPEKESHGTGTSNGCIASTKHRFLPVPCNIGDKSELEKENHGHCGGQWTLAATSPILNFVSCPYPALKYYETE